MLSYQTYMRSIFNKLINKRYKVLSYIVFLWLGDNFCISAWAQHTQRPSIIGISHVAFKVKDISKAINFYRDFLGYKAIQIQKGSNSKEQISFIVNDRQHIEVYSGLAANQDERMLEVAFQVTDAEAMRLYLFSMGVKVPEIVSKGREGNLSFVVEDPEKHLIKFIQYHNLKRDRGFRLKQKGQAVSDRILHVGIIISNVKSADAFYQDILGFSEIWRGGRPNNITNWINMRVPEGTDYVEYMLVTDPVNKQQLGVLHHVALQVPSVQNALDMLRKKVNGPAFYNIEVPRVGQNNRWQLNLYDSDGTRVELMEPFTFR